MHHTQVASAVVGTVSHPMMVAAVGTVWTPIETIATLQIDLRATQAMVGNTEMQPSSQQHQGPALLDMLVCILPQQLNLRSPLSLSNSHQNQAWSVPYSDLGCSHSLNPLRSVFHHKQSTLPKQFKSVLVLAAGLGPGLGPVVSAAPRL
jgi:hypothetical protein